MTFPATDIDDLPDLLVTDRDAPAGNPITPVITPAAPPPSDTAPRHQITDSNRILSYNLSKIELEDEDEGEIAVFHTGKIFDWRYGETEIKTSALKSMKKNFENRVLHPNAPLERQICLQVGHGILSDPHAVGWAKSIRLAKGDDGTTYMYVTFKLNDDGKVALSGGRYAFVSPSFDMEYVSQKIGEDGERSAFGPTIFHIALTNSPVLAELPSIALSRTITPMDVKYEIPKEVTMTQPQEPTPPTTPTEGDGQPAPQADPNKLPATTPQPNHEPQGNDGPPPAQPATNLSIPNGKTLVDQTEYSKLQETVRNLTIQSETLAKEAHAIKVDGITKEAAGRGVPPVVLNLVKSIMLVSHPSAPKAVNFSKEDGSTVDFNIFEAMGELLEVIPKIDLRQHTPEPAGDRPGPTNMTIEEAEEAGRKLWATTGIVPELIGYNGKGQ